MKDSLNSMAFLSSRASLPALCLSLLLSSPSAFSDGGLSGGESGDGFKSGPAARFSKDQSNSASTSPSVKTSPSSGDSSSSSVRPTKPEASSSQAQDKQPARPAQTQGTVAEDGMQWKPAAKSDAWRGASGDAQGVAGQASVAQKGSQPSSPVVLSVSLDLRLDDGVLSARPSPSSGLDFGLLAEGQRVEGSVKIKNTLKDALKASPVKQDIPGLSIEGLSEEIAAGSSVEAKISFEAKGFHGEFKRFLFLSLSSGGRTCDASVPFKFASAGEPAQAAGGSLASEPTPSSIVFVEYEEGGLGSHPDSAAWIFAERQCPGLNYLKKALLPKLLEKAGASNSEVVTVDLDRKASKELLGELEEKLEAEGGRTPVLYWKGKLLYGCDAIKSLLGE